MRFKNIDFFIFWKLKSTGILDLWILTLDNIDFNWQF